MLKKVLIQSLHSFSSWIPLNWLQLISKQHLLPIFYHTISDQELPHIKHLYQVRNTQLFEEDLDYLLQSFTPIDLHQLIDHIYQGKKLPRNAFFLTFDDGLSECYHVISPILKRKGIPATFFLNSDFIDNKALMFRYKASYLIEQLLHQKNIAAVVAKQFEKHQLSFLSIKRSLLDLRWTHKALLDDLAKIFNVDFDLFLQQTQPYLTKEQINIMLEDGFTFGSHSQNHPTYNLIPLKQQLEQTIQSQNHISHQFQLPYKIFAFPFTDTGVESPFFDKILGKENFQLTFGGAGLKKEKIMGQVQRFGMETQRNTSAKQLIHTEYCYYIIKSFFRKNVIYRS